MNLVGLSLHEAGCPATRHGSEATLFRASLRVATGELTFDQLKELAPYAGNQEKLPRLRVAKASKLTFAQLKEIAAFGTGAIFFVFDQP